MLGNLITAALLMAVAFACWCRLQAMTPGVAKPEVQRYFMAVALGASASAAAHAMAVVDVDWQPWAALPFAAALLGALIANRKRWPGRPPADVEPKP